MKKISLILMLLISVAAVYGQGGQQRQRTGAQQQGGQDRVTFNVAGSLLTNPQRVNVPVEELPKAITDNVAKAHSGFNIREAKWDWSTTLVPGNIFVYEVVISNGTKDQVLLYNKDGKFLNIAAAPSGK